MTPPESSAAQLPPLAIEQPKGELIAFTSGQFVIPPKDLSAFDKLTEVERERIRLLLSCFGRMAAGDVVAQSHALALELSSLRGYSHQNLRTLYYAYKRHGWRALVRGYRGPSDVPDEFKQWFRAQCDKNSRSIRAQIGVVRRLWEAGTAIPGYGTWQQWFLTEFPDRDLPRCCPGYPKGWSQSALYLLQPTKAERMLKTRGYAAAKQYFASMERDPSKLRPLELIVIDDFEPDQMCVYLDHETGTRQVTRMTGLLAMDVASRTKLSLGIKPRLVHDDGRKENIHRRELRLMLYYIFATYGVPKDYPVTILVENASAAIEHDFELALTRLFGGRIRVCRTGLIDYRTLSNGFVQRGGKPWEKGWIESAFNLVHNIAAVLPGQKGANYTKKPAELAAMVIYNERLLSVGPQGLNLTDEQVSRLQFTFPSRDAFIQCYEVIFQLMESRTNHSMLGFDEVIEWRLEKGAPLQAIEELDLLPPEQRESVIIPPPRKESPRERWEKLNARPDCAREKIEEHVLAALMLQPKKAKLRNGRVTFTHQGKGYTFADRAAYVLNEREGQEVLCFFDEKKMDKVHVYDERGAHIQTIDNLAPADITDPASIARAAKMVKELENQTREAVRARHLGEAAEQVGMLEHNEAIAPGAHLDPAIRRALGLKVDDVAKLNPANQAAIATAATETDKPQPTGEFTPRKAGLARTLAAGQQAGPLTRDAFAGAEAVSKAALHAEQDRQRTGSLKRARNDAANLADERSEEEPAQQPNFSPSELL